MWAPNLDGLSSQKFPSGGFHSHGGTPIAGLVKKWKVPSKKMDDLGVAPFFGNPHTGYNFKQTHVDGYL